MAKGGIKSFLLNVNKHANQGLGSLGSSFIDEDQSRLPRKGNQIPIHSCNSLAAIGNWKLIRDPRLL